MTIALLVILALLAIAILCIGLGIRADIKEQEKTPECFSLTCRNYDEVCGDCPWSE